MTTQTLKRTAIPLVGLSLLTAYCQGGQQAPPRPGALASPSDPPTDSSAAAISASNGLPANCSDSVWSATIPPDLNLRMSAGQQRTIPAGYVDFEAFTPAGLALQRAWCTTGHGRDGYFLYTDVSGRKFMTYNGVVVVAKRPGSFGAWRPVPEK